MEVTNMSKMELEKLQVEKENEYQKTMEELTTIEIKDAELSRKVAEIQLERKNLSMSLIKGKFVVRRIASELRNIKTLIYKRLSEENC